MPSVLAAADSASRVNAASVVNSTMASPRAPSGWVVAPCIAPGRGLRCQFLHHFQRHHFACHLGETFDAPDDGDEAVVVDSHHIARFVPALARFGGGRLQHSGIVVAVVAGHHVGAAHMQHAALVDAGHGDQAMLDARQQLADGAAAIRHRRIHRQHRRGLGRAITFQDADAEFFEPQIAHRGGEFFRARHDIAQAEEIVGMGELGVVGEEGAGAEHHAAIAVVGHFRNDAVVQRRGIEEQVHAGHDRQQRAAGEAEGMEDRQRVEHFVFGREVDDGAYLRDVGQQRAMRQHHALGLAFGAGGEQHHRRAFRIAALFHHAREQHAEQHPQLVAHAHARTQVFQIQNLYAL